jgi:hypothetical protein
MAAAILKGLNFPMLVSSAEIDAAAGKAGAVSNCRITEVAASEDGVRFQRLDQSLPFYPTEARSILTWSPILEELNQYRLKVTGLKPGKYEIRLDGQKAAIHSAEELAQGINLAEGALTTGPIAEQVKAVKAAIEAKNRYHHDRVFRGVVLSNVAVPDWLNLNLGPAEIEARRKAAYDERMARLPELDSAIRKALATKPHQVEIVAAQP